MGKVVYCLISPSCKTYIGQTKRNLNKRLYEHETREDCILIYNAIQKYGIDNFTCEILYESDDSDKINEMETYFIKELNTLHPNGYNIRTGGVLNSKHCEASREKMRQSKLGSKNFNFGKPRTSETREKISLSKKGEKHHFYGKELSYEHKLNLSRSHKKDNILPMYIVRIKARPEHYCSAGYAVCNHSTLKNKYFTSKKNTDEENFRLASEYLDSANN